jgi:gluconolactonase
VYAGCGGGVRVYAPDATFLGMIGVEGGVANLCFGGDDGRTLLMLNEHRAFTVRLRCRGAI